MTCVTCKKDFAHEDEDLAMYATMDIPPADECPRCRIRHLFAFWNFGVFRKTTSALSGKSLITVLPEEVKYPIYSREEWVSDAWDPMDYGRKWDPARPFFEQMVELRDAVPHPHQIGVRNTNCEWCDDVWDSKNCYLSRSFINGENLIYGYRNAHCKDSIDSVYSFTSDQCYDCLDCFKCYELKYSSNCSDCIQGAFLYDCRNLQNCFMCWNLRNKQYCIRNRQYSKEEYAEEMKKYDLHSYAAVEGMKKEFLETVAREAVHRQDYNIQIQNCEGAFLTECRNCYDCGFLEKSENCRHVWRGIDSKEVIDSVGALSEKTAVAAAPMFCYDTVGISNSASCRYSAYLETCEECEYCFACVGLRKKKYCVFNMQYSKEEYEDLINRIKAAMRASGEWGRFYPISMSPFGYNVTTAQIYFPESKESAAAIGAKWHEFSDSADGMNPANLPDRIDDAPDSVTAQPLICPETGRKFNIAPHELSFYRQHGIPLPRRHFDHRVMDSFRRMTMASVKGSGKCVYCGKDIVHFFDPALGYQKISCVECYQREVA